MFLELTRPVFFFVFFLKVPLTVKSAAAAAGEVCHLNIWFCGERPHFSEQMRWYAFKISIFRVRTSNGTHHNC